MSTSLVDATNKFADTNDCDIVLLNADIGRTTERRLSDVI